jgi:2-hydroxymuconate-semialdehyde hydrolase
VNPDRERLVAEAPLTGRRLTVGGATTAVLEGGDGPPLVLMHGGIECGGAYWAPVVSELADSHRLIVPDLPGCGESAPLPRLDENAFANWLTDLIRQTCEKEPALVAHSLLGSYAARYAAKHGDRLRRLVIYGAPGVGRYRMPLRFMAVAIRSDLRPTRRNLERFMRWAMLDQERTRARDEQWFDAFCSYVVDRSRVPHCKRAMRQLIKAGTKRVPDDELRRIDIPTALLWGRHDRMIPLSLAEEASARLGWPLHVVDDCGHVPHVERPEAFVRALTAALPRPGPRQAAMS